MVGWWIEEKLEKDFNIFLYTNFFCCSYFILNCRWTLYNTNKSSVYINKQCLRNFFNGKILKFPQLWNVPVCEFFLLLVNATCNVFAVFQMFRIRCRQNPWCQTRVGIGWHCRGRRWRLVVAFLCWPTKSRPGRSAVPAGQRYLYRCFQMKFTKSSS